MWPGPSSSPPPWARPARSPPPRRRSGTTAITIATGRNDEDSRDRSRQMMREKKITLGFVPANRGFFSAELAAKMRGQTIEVLNRLGVEVVVPDTAATKVGCVENRKEAELCAGLFRQKEVQGIVIGAMN